MATENKNKDGDDNKKSTLSLGGTLGLKNPGTIKSRSTSGNSVTVEVKRKRSPGSTIKTLSERKKEHEAAAALAGLTEKERVAREKALEAARKHAEEEEKKRVAEEKARAEEDARRKAEGLPTLAEEEAMKAEDEKKKKEAEKTKKEEPKPAKSARDKELEELQKIKSAEDAERAKKEARQKELMKNRPAPSSADTGFASRKTQEKENDDRPRRSRMGDSDTGGSFRAGRLTVNQAMNYEYEVEQRQQRRMKNKRNRSQMNEEPKEKQVRDVVIPETITVQELAKRMTEKSADVVKALMKLGVMATINQNIDADTAELIVTEFGHRFTRVTEADVETGIEDIEDDAKDLVDRAPVVTIMGHVDHGKTSILDALRKTDVVSGEAGGITQHIGAYQITRPNGKKITFLDTPGHAAFTEMRARGANVTDVVVLVVAANDSVMPQTIEAIHHAKAANVPMIVAINKCDLPEANAKKVKEELLQHEVIVEDYSGDVMAVEVSAKTGAGLDALEEAILLQAEILELKANPDRTARGAVVEAKLDKGRGAVATVLIQKGTLNVGDLFITGAEWGRVRAMVNDKGQNIETAGPALPVEVLGLTGAPNAGDDFIVVGSESEAREITEYRQRKNKEMDTLAKASTIDQLFAQAKDGEKKTLPVILKADVQGSVEAIIGSLKKLTEENEEVEVKVIHSGVGEITEADVTLANASNGVIVGFNVRANAQARDKAKQEGREIRYYSIIYNVLDDMKAILGGMLSPDLQEDFIGYAEIRQVFNITKVGKVAGCMITDGVVRRGAKVRLLRDNVVIHEGTLKTLKRVKEEVKEVREGTECGMAFESYDDIKEGDVIECFEVKEVAREL